MFDGLLTRIPVSSPFTRLPIPSPVYDLADTAEIENLKALYKEAENAKTALAFYQVVKTIANTPIIDELMKSAPLEMPKRLPPLKNLRGLCKIQIKAQWAIDAAQKCIARDVQCLTDWDEEIDAVETPETLQEITEKITNFNIRQKLEFFDAIAEHLKAAPDLLLEKCTAKTIALRKCPQMHSSNHIHILDKDMLRLVFSFLDATSVVSASKVCKEWERLNQSLLWAVRPGMFPISYWQDFINCTIDYLEGVHFPLEKQHPAGIQALKDLHTRLGNAPNSLPKIFNRDELISRELRSILDCLDFLDSLDLAEDKIADMSNIDKDLKKNLAEFTFSMMLSATRRHLSIGNQKLTVEEWSKMKNLLSLLRNNGCFPVTDDSSAKFREILNRENISLDLFRKFIEISSSTPVMQLCDVLIKEWKEILYLNQPQCPPGEEIFMMNLLIKHASFKEAWRLLHRVSAKTNSLPQIGEDLSLWTSNTYQKLSKIWTKSLPSVIATLCARGDDENAFRLVYEQKQKFKIELLQKMGTTYAKLNQAEHVKPILERLDKEGTGKAIESQSKILETLVFKEGYKGNLGKALHYFERLRPITGAKDQLRILHNLAVNVIDRHPAKKDTVRARLQKELPDLLLELSKNKRAYQEFFSKDVFPFLTLLCKVEEMEQARGLMKQALTTLRTIHKESTNVERNSKFFTQLLKHEVPSLLCKMGQAADAQKLVDQAMEAIRQRLPDDVDFASEILYHDIPSSLWKIGNTEKAANLVDQLIDIQRQVSSSDKAFFQRILDDGLLLLLCETGRVAKARELMDQAIVIFRREYPGTDALFEQLVKHSVFANLCTMGAIDEAERSFATMPTNFAADPENIYLWRGNQQLKGVARKLLEDMVETTSRETRDKVVQILGMLIADPNKHSLIESVSSWKTGDDLPLSTYTEESDFLDYLPSPSSSSSSSDSSSSSSSSDSDGWDIDY